MSKFLLPFRKSNINKIMYVYNCKNCDSNNFFAI